MYLSDRNMVKPLGDIFRGVPKPFMVDDDILHTYTRADDVRAVLPGAVLADFDVWM